MGANTTNGDKNGTAKSAEVILGVGDIVKQRSGTHGDAFKNLQDIGARWSRLINGILSKQDKGEALTLGVADVAYMMVEMKLSRATYGDAAEIDHFMDMIGYAGIGAASIKDQKKRADELTAKINTKPDRGCC